ncbi:hypothetical protein MVLG_06514 [Microbotryum lychnidis-dioicae p1A1 Lamole]|uniref:Transcription initiation factor TFIID subunit 2 n=1 Tax=Microbotryum lychnidis-dioicae (strain p1A1 Lamole / MvSl-1064) TaxID=683840 RepID=U5HHI3_USTV1|nr:hypothetical protein MVLG_06514 [Microbotryum lychnidis-dioicae p1A1 Lamole]|eukprot:KDE02980.1 hypothetical protein MVLG_06514 [Microbotryum lychnidis-dioicae p1A1 Lamole]
MGKGFTLLSQKVSINVALNGKIHGNTELTIAPTTADLRTVWLHARSMNVLATALRLPTTTVPLAFSYIPPLAPTLTEPHNVHTYPELKRAVWRSTNEGEEGEVGIAIPQGSVVKLHPASHHDEANQAKKQDEWEPVVLVIEYEVVSPGAGIVVVAPDETNPSRFPHVFTSTLSEISARHWVPCLDHAKDRCTWDLEFIVPRVLYSASASTLSRPTDVDGQYGPEAIDLDDEEEVEWPVSVVASGELVEQVVHPERSDRVIWHYAQVTPVSVQQIAWAVGPFVVAEIAPTPKENAANAAAAEGEDDEGAEEEEDPLASHDGAKLHALCLPGREAEMANCVGIVRRAMDFYTSKFGSYPFTNYTVAFVDALSSGSPTFHSAGLTILSSDMLHPASIIDQAFETRHTLAHALAVQWSGINLIARTASDVWLVIGIAQHITSLFLREVWGNNEYRFRLKKDMIRCVAQDVQREPLSVPARLAQPEPAQLQFIALKAPLVLYIFDKFLRNAGTSLGLDKVLPKIFLDAITGDTSTTSTGNYNALSTTTFQRMCRKACGGSADAIRNFFDQWVYASGCPTFVVSAVFNRKRMAIELSIKQECLAHLWAQSAPWEETGHLRPVACFEGQMTIRIHEADGTPYEHVLSISESFKRHEVPFNTKYKRIRRNTKRYQARQAAAQAAAAGDLEAAEDVALIDVGFGSTLWEEEVERERWQVADWTEEDDVLMSQATYEWIRIDAEMDWIARIQFEQPDFMWISQLQRDRDVVAQLEAIHALSHMCASVHRNPEKPAIHDTVVSSNLCKTVLVGNYFIRIRMEAALALVSCATNRADYLGLFHLFKLFQSWFCFEPAAETKDPFAFRCIPKTNDFSDMSLYFLKKALIQAISMARDEQGQTPAVVHQFLIDLLAYNDNLGNRLSDAFYIVSIINALGYSFAGTPLKRDLGIFGADEGTFGDEASSLEALEPALAAVERYLSTDRLVPSFQNAITVAGIEFKLRLMMASLLPEDRMSFFIYTRDGNYPPVRIAAFEALLLLNPFQDMQESIPLVQYLFAVLRDDSSRLVQRRLAQALVEILPFLAVTKDLGAAPETGLEEFGAGSTKKGDSIQSTLKALRKKPGRSNNFRQCLLQTLTHPDIDPEVRDCMLKLAEVTIRPEGEPLPKITFRMPVVAESPVAAPVSATTPRLKLTNTQTASLPRIKLGGSTAAPPAAENPAPLEIPVPVPTTVKPKKTKVKAPPKLEHAQASGMSHSDFTACKSMVKKLLKDKHVTLFQHPVDPVKSGAPGYWDIVHHPMDVSTLSAKLNNGDYADRYAFRADFKLIISNAILYNVQGVVVDLARKLDAFFDKQWDRIEATLKMMEVPTPAVPAAQMVEPVASASTTTTTSKKASEMRPPVLKLATNPLPPPPPPPPPAELPADEFAPTPTVPLSTGLSFKIKPRAPAPAPTAVATPPVRATPPPLAPAAQKQNRGAASPALPTPSLGFKIKFGGAATTPTAPNGAAAPLTAAPGGPTVSPVTTPKPPKAPKPLKAPKMSRTTTDDATYGAAGSTSKQSSRSVGSNGDAAAGVEDVPRPFKEKKKRKEVNYADPPDDVIEPPSARGPVAVTEAYPTAPLRPPVLDEPKLPPPSTWINPNDRVDPKKVRQVMAKIKGMREAFWFLKPVDPVALPVYYQEISEPMDLQTMEAKLDHGSYATYADVFADFDRIVANCQQFNPPNTEPVWHVLMIQRAWSAEWEKASRMSYHERRSILALLNKILKEGASWPFRESVNTIIDQIPTYYSIITPGTQRDLGTIKANVEKDRYASIDEVDADVELMLYNCFRFNASPEHQVYQSGLELQKMWRGGLAKAKAEMNKKRTGDKASAGGPTKKQKI